MEDQNKAETGWRFVPTRKGLLITIVVSDESDVSLYIKESTLLPLDQLEKLTNKVKELAATRGKDNEELLNEAKYHPYG